MKIIQVLQSEKLSSVFVYGAFMIANIDYVGIVDYTIKAVLGALIWFVLKVGQEYVSAKLIPKPIIPAPLVKRKTAKRRFKIFSKKRIVVSTSPIKKIKAD
jgi:hypothetical protein